IADEADAFGFGIALQLGDQGQGRDGFEVQIENDQRRLGLGFLQEFLAFLDKLQGETIAPGGLAQLDGEKEIGYHREDSLGFLLRHRLVLFEVTFVVEVTRGWRRSNSITKRGRASFARLGKLKHAPPTHAPQQPETTEVQWERDS